MQRPNAEPASHRRNATTIIERLDLPREIIMLKFLASTVGIIFLIGLLVVIGVLALIF